MEAPDRLSKVYGALAHPVRRAILTQLAGGEARVGDIATRFDMTAPAITNHLKVLEDGLILKSEAHLFASRAASWDAGASKLRAAILARFPTE